jgi:hypothetical protein
VNSGDQIPTRPRGITAFGVFLLWGAGTASLAGITLVWPRTALDHIWSLNPRAHAQLAPLGSVAGLGLLIVAVALGTAGVGWFKRRLWAWWLAVAIMAAQIVGDLVNLFLGRVIEGVIGIAAAGALLIYLFRAPVRAIFRITTP